VDHDNTLSGVDKLTEVIALPLDILIASLSGIPTDYVNIVAHQRLTNSGSSRPRTGTWTVIPLRWDRIDRDDRRLAKNDDFLPGQYMGEMAERQGTQVPD